VNMFHLLHISQYNHYGIHPQVSAEAPTLDLSWESEVARGDGGSLTTQASNFITTSTIKNA